MTKLFKEIEKVGVLIVGDVMIDRYLVGEVTRISPEAPVPIVHLNKTENRLGGAANVALNIKAMGATPYLCSVIGEDSNAFIFKDLLQKSQILNTGIITSTERMTTTKTRILSRNQQLLRFDEEVQHDLSQKEEDTLFTQIQTTLHTQNIQVVLIQDYNKGILTKSLIQRLLSLCKEQNIPVTVDPKFHNFFEYKGVKLFKPNLKEVTDQLNTPINTSSIDSLNQTCQALRQRLNHEYTLLTLSEKGVYLDAKNKGKLIPTQARKVADVCGAGDTVISVAALGIAVNLDMEQVAILANLAGGQVCERVGVVPVDKEQLELEYFKIIKKTDN